MSAEEICQLMARTWKEAGGDAMGFYWCWRRILDEVQKLKRPPDGSIGPQHG